MRQHTSLYNGRLEKYRYGCSQHTSNTIAGMQDVEDHEIPKSPFCPLPATDPILLSDMEFRVPPMELVELAIESRRDGHRLASPGAGGQSCWEKEGPCRAKRSRRGRKRVETIVGFAETVKGRHRLACD